METQPRSAPKLTYFLLAIEVIAAISGGVWFFLQQRGHRPEARPPFEAVAFVGSSPISSTLVSQHSAGFEVLRKPAGAGAAAEDAMIGDAVAQWGDYSPVAGRTVLNAPEDAKLKPVITALRLTPDRGQLRALSFGPGAFLEGLGDPAQKPFPLELAPDYPGLTAIQMVRCRVEPGKALTTLQLSNPKSGNKWLVIRANSDGSFESRLTPAAIAQQAGGPQNAFVLVSVTWDPRPTTGTYRLAVRPVDGLPRQSKEAKLEGKGLEPLSQVQIGEKLDAGAAASGSMEVAETVIFNREIGTKDVMRIEDWIIRHYFSDVPARGPFNWVAAGLTSSWGDDSSWSDSGVPAANEEANFTSAPRPEPITIKLDGTRLIKSLNFSSASPSWTIAEGSVPNSRLIITDGDSTSSEDIGAVASVDGTTLELQAGLGGVSGAASDELIFLGDGGTVNFRKSIGLRAGLGSRPAATRGMTYALEAANIVGSRLYVGFHDNPAANPVNGAVSTFVRVNQSQTTTADQIRIGGGGGSQFGVLTIQNKATWNQDKGSMYIGYSGSNGTQNRSNGRVELGHTNSTGNLTIGNDATLKIGDLGGTGVLDVNNGTLTVKASNDTVTVIIGNCGSDQKNGGANGTLNLNEGGTIVTARNFTRIPPATSGSAKFNFNGGLLRINRSSGNVTTDLIGPGITVTLSGPGARIETNNNNTKLARDLSGAGGLEKLGNGTLTLSGKNSYTGKTTVSGGVLSIAGSALPPATRLELKGGKVELTGPASVAGLVFQGSPQASGTWGGPGSGAEHVDEAHFSGPGVLTVRAK